MQSPWVQSMYFIGLATWALLCIGASIYLALRSRVYATLKTYRPSLLIVQAIASTFVFIFTYFNERIDSVHWAIPCSNLFYWFRYVCGSGLFNLMSIAILYDMSSKRICGRRPSPRKVKFGFLVMWCLIMVAVLQHGYIASGTPDATHACPATEVYEITLAFVSLFHVFWMVVIEVGMMEDSRRPHYDVRVRWTRVMMILFSMLPVVVNFLHVMHASTDSSSVRAFLSLMELTIVCIPIIWWQTHSVLRPFSMVLLDDMRILYSVAGWLHYDVAKADCEEYMVHAPSTAELTTRVIEAAWIRFRLHVDNPNYEVHDHTVVPVFTPIGNPMADFRWNQFVNNVIDGNDTSFLVWMCMYADIFARNQTEDESTRVRQTKQILNAYVHPERNISILHAMDESVSSVGGDDDLKRLNYFDSLCEKLSTNLFHLPGLRQAVLNQLP